MSANPRRILVVDDNLPAVRGLAQLLVLLGHEVQEAYNGASALQIDETFSPDVVILDIGLPDMTGYEVAVVLRERPGARMLIALSGYGQAEDKEEARAAGFHHHLTKPAGLAELRPILDSL